MGGGAWGGFKKWAGECREFCIAFLYWFSGVEPYTPPKQPEPLAPEPTTRTDEGARLASLEDVKRAGLCVGDGILLGRYPQKSDTDFDGGVPLCDEEEHEDGSTITAKVLSGGEIVGTKKSPDGHILKSFIAFPIGYKGENHLITIGKPGSGKGTTVIIPVLLRYPGSCFVIDPKGNIPAITARQRRNLGNRVICLNPYGLHRERLGDSARFNPLHTLNPKSVNFVGDVGSLASALIYPTGNDPHWSDSARELVACLIMHVCTKPGETRTLPRVRQLLCLPDLQEGEDDDERGKRTGTKKEKSPFLALIAEMSVSGFPPLANKAAQFTESTREIKSIISQARTQTAFLDDPVIAECLSGSDFDFAEMKQARMTVYLVLPAKYMQFQARWFRLLVTSAIDALTGEPQPGDKRVLFVLDEFAQLGRLEAIEKALALVRGYGIQLWPFVQDLPQLKGVYPDRWESFLATAGIAQFFTPNDDMTAKYISERCGKRLVTRTSRSYSSQSGSQSGRQNGNSDNRSSSGSSSGTSSGTSSGSSSGSSSSQSFSEHWEPVFSTWDLYGKMLPQTMQIIFAEGTSHAIYCGRSVIYFYDMELSKLADPDPYHVAPNE